MSSLLRLLSTVRPRSEPFEVRYDSDRHVSQVRELSGDWVDSWASGRLAETKKADLETGEDQKGT